MSLLIWKLMPRSNADVDRVYVPYHRRKRGVVAVYRVGSRFDGTARPDSDMDYMLLIDSDQPYGNCWVSGHKNFEFDMWIETIYFTRGDLQNPGFLEESVSKVAFLFEKYRGRELLAGYDVFDQWLSPDIARLFEFFNLSQERAKQILHSPIFES